MRIVARFGLGLCGLALVVPGGAKADPPAYIDARSVESAQSKSGHQHKGLLGWRHCVECQRARAKARDGVDVPPPPAMAPGVQGQVVHQHGPAGHQHGPVQDAGCAACQAGTVVTGPVTIIDSNAPGYAVIGGPQGENAPGYAVVGGPIPGADPAPIGVAQSRQYPGPGPVASGARPGMGPYDPAVLPSSMIPAQTALGSGSHNRPHVVGHMLGVTGIGRSYREARERKNREKHAAISYDPPAQPVTELPASMVYGKRH